MKFAVIMLGLFSVGTAMAKEVTAELKVPAMDCAACSVVIRKALNQTSGVTRVDLNVEKRIATVVYDDTRITETDIAKRIEKAGFKVETAK